MKSQHDVFSDPELLLDYYNIQTGDYRMRQAAIWTEVKHYTWVLSFLLGSGPIAIVSGKVFQSDHMYLLLILSALGSVISIIAFFIIRKDFAYYSDADARLLYLERCLGTIDHPDYLDKRLQRAHGNKYSVMVYAEEHGKIWNPSSSRPRIRSLILFTFLLYGIGGVMESIYYIVHLGAH